MTDRDGRSNDAKPYKTKVFHLGQHPLSSSSTSVTVNETNPLTIPNTDSEGDYETSSEGPHSPGREFKQSATTFTDSYDEHFLPESNYSTSVSTARFPKEDSRPQNDPSASYTIIGAGKSPRTDVTSNILKKVEIQAPLNRVDELEARRTEYFLAHRIETNANKSESLPVITIATPWGSYEYPDVRMPAERLVSDSPVDIKEKMRLIGACMDGSDLLTSRTDFFDYQSEDYSYQDVKQDDMLKAENGGIIEAECKIDNISINSKPVTPRTPKLISVTSPKIFSEPLNVLPIIRNPNFGSDFTVPPSPSGSSLPVTTNNNTVSISSSFYNNREIAESPRNFITGTKPSYDPLSRIEGELAPLQNELSEIRGKVRALNLDYNLSCIDGIGKIPRTVNWITTGSGNQSYRPHITPVKDDFILNDYHSLNNQTLAFSTSSFDSKYRRPFAACNRPFVTSAYSYGLKEVEDACPSVESNLNTTGAIHPDPPPHEIFSSQNCEPEIASPPVGTDRKLSHVYICTSTPSSLSTKVEVEPAIESEEDSESCAEEEKTCPEIRLPDFLDKISIVPIIYLGGMPDPSVEPVFSFEEPEEDGVFRIPHKFLRIEHPDAPQRRQDTKRSNENQETSASSISDTVLRSENDTESSLSTSKEQDDSSVENSARSSYRIISKFAKKSSSSNISNFTTGQKLNKKTYIRGLISGPEDFLLL